MYQIFINSVFGQTEILREMSVPPIFPLALLLSLVSLVTFLRGGSSETAFQRKSNSPQRPTDRPTEAATPMGATIRNARERASEDGQLICTSVESIPKYCESCVMIHLRGITSLKWRIDSCILRFPVQKSPKESIHDYWGLESTQH